MSNSFQFACREKETMTKAFYAILNDKDVHHVWKAGRWFENVASQFVLPL